MIAIPFLNVCMYVCTYICVYIGFPSLNPSPLSNPIHVHSEPQVAYYNVWPPSPMIANVGGIPQQVPTPTYYTSAVPSYKSPMGTNSSIMWTQAPGAIPTAAVHPSIRTNMKGAGPTYPGSPATSISPNVMGGGMVTTHEYLC